MLNHLQRETSPSSLRNKLMCCFSKNVHIHHEPMENYEYSSRRSRTPRTPRSPCTWIRKFHNLEFREIRGRSPGKSMCGVGRRQRNSRSADFSYDPYSYALNFEDDNHAEDKEFSLRKFCDRLPSSQLPERSSQEIGTVAINGELLGCV